MNTQQNGSHDQEADQLLNHNENLLEKIAQFISETTSKNKQQEIDINRCLLLTHELETCLCELEEMHKIYQNKLAHTETQFHGINSYAQTMALTSPNTKGDIIHVD